MFENLQNTFSGNQNEASFMGNGEDDPKKRKKQLMIFIFGSNLFINILYLGVMFLDGKSFVYKMLHDIFHVFSPYPTITIFLYIQIIVAFIYFKQLKTNVIPKKKENIFTFLNLINFILLLILINGALLSYFGTDEKSFGAIGMIMLIFSGAFFGLNAKNIFLDLKNTLMSIIKPEEVVEESEEEGEEIKKYDWLPEYYTNGDEPKAKLSFYRFNYGKIFPYLIEVINQTLIFEKGKLLPKEIIENEDDSLYVQVDYPTIESQDDLDDFIDGVDFNNEYVKINNTFVALKLRTKFLRDPKHLEKIGEDILPNQIKTLLNQITFQPSKPYAKDSEEYDKMINDLGKPYLLFNKVSIQQFGEDWFVVFNYTKYYRQLVIFPQMQTLPELYEEKDIEIFPDAYNPMIYLGEKTTSGHIAMTLSKIKHMLFGGESGSGKSVFLRSLIYQIIYSSTPDKTKLVLIDPLKVSFQIFKKLKNLAYPVAITLEDTNDAINFLYKTNFERYGFLESLGYEDIYSFNKDVDNKIINIVDKETGIPTKYKLERNKNPKFENYPILSKEDYKKYSKNGYDIYKTIPQIICIYDEFNAYNSEPLYEKNGSVATLSKLGEQARKAGIVLILGTQTINADTVPTSLRQNLSTRVCLTVASKSNSRAIIGDSAANNTDGNLLSGWGDMLVYNNVELNQSNAIRAQGFFVSEHDILNLVKENLEMFGKNDFMYKEGEDDIYDWITYFYARQLINEEKVNLISDDLLERNNKEYGLRKIALENMLPILIGNLNTFFKSQRTELLDKTHLEDKNKNIQIQSVSYQTEEEFKEFFARTKYSNLIFEISDSFMKIKLDTSFLSAPEKLFKMEDKIELQLNDLKNLIFFEPIKPYRSEKPEELEKLNKMKELTDGKEYTLIDNFEITKNKNGFFIQLNFTKWYKDTVVFPNSKTARQVLTEQYGNKIETMLRGEKFIYS